MYNETYSYVKIGFCLEEDLYKKKAYNSNLLLTKLNHDREMLNNLSTNPTRAKLYRRSNSLNIDKADFNKFNTMIILTSIRLWMQEHTVIFMTQHVLRERFEKLYNVINMNDPSGEWFYNDPNSDNYKNIIELHDYFDVIVGR
jgi:hypothetical protein